MSVLGFFPDTPGPPSPPTHPRGPGCLGITTLRLCPAHSVVLSVSLPPAIWRQGLTDFNCGFSLPSDTAGERAVHKPSSVFPALNWRSRGGGVYKREKGKPREGGGELLLKRLYGLMGGKLGLLILHCRV